ncbi:DegT/DnrJ/EryC1/StrS family aminotransferase [Glycomyces buryatensis]|uniref:DegT/DnrJ/EryC1/StrS family aminotransferase n=1 Tax=Glycomyces buryatensis TaxID=2570927 RepID=A0A4S8QPQ0_9ACTN|nr:DegT/DnrJ/EryC1/StrS family aminotransferase [Glycomyces buryatensis]THV43389.1 DegT/DnrJ/EryC1/StrS family aminotransferase [Glycomyces buryatensis]
MPGEQRGAGTRGDIPPAKPYLGEAEIEAAVAVLRSGMVVQGPEVAGFEDEFTKVAGTQHCVAVNSGTSALQLALMAMGIGRGDEVIVPSFSFAASANAVRLVGAEPVFADIEPGSFCIDPEHVASLIGPRTAAIMPVHLYGHPADCTRLTALARVHGLQILEDACQAHGAEVDGKPVGSFGVAGAFSFYPTKNMHALEGGMVTTDDAGLARTLRLLRNQGMEQRYANEIVGANMRMTDVSAAIGRVQLGRLGDWTEQRRANAAFLDAAFADVEGVLTPSVPAGARHVYHQYTVRIAGDRDGAQRQLKEAGVGSAVYYPVPIHRLAPYAESKADLPETDRAAAEVLSLPVHPSLTGGDLDRIVDAVRSLELQP